MHRFRAKLYKIGTLCCVDVPAAVSRHLGDETAIPVRGSAQGVPLRSTLTPRGEGRHRLFVHSRALRANGLDAGDRVEIMLERDPESRETETPKDFLRALEDRPAARAVFTASGDGLRREIANWLAAAKHVETRERRIEKALDTLEARAEQRRKSALRPKNAK